MTAVSGSACSLIRPCWSLALSFVASIFTFIFWSPPRWPDVILSFRWSVGIAEIYFQDFIGDGSQIIDVLVLIALTGHSCSWSLAERVCILVAACSTFV